MPAPAGNKNAKKQNRTLTDTLRRVIAQNPAKVKKACEAMLDKAAGGDYAAFREIFDRHDGKPNVSISGPGGGPIQARLSIEFVN